MTRRDIIIIATLVNAGLLAILFMMAVTSDDDVIRDSYEASKALVEVRMPEASRPIYESTAKPKPIEIAIQRPMATPVQMAANIPSEVRPVGQTRAVDPYEDPEEASVQETKIVTAPKSTQPTQQSEGQYVEVTVKRGDSLDKIARAHGTTVRAIKDANELKNDRLDLGQVLQVPANQKVADNNSKTSTSKPAASKTVAAASTASLDSNYYVMQTGDSPWKIAKRFHMDLDDLLALNNLDEEKARNLRVGDKIRVK